MSKFCEKCGISKSNAEFRVEFNQVICLQCYTREHQLSRSRPHLDEPQRKYLRYDSSSGLPTSTIRSNPQMLSRSSTHEPQSPEPLSASMLPQTTEATRRSSSVDFSRSSSRSSSSDSNVTSSDSSEDLLLSGYIAEFDINWGDIDLNRLILDSSQAVSYTIGDLHGNTLTLIIVLIKFGLLDLDRESFNEIKRMIVDISANRVVLNLEMFIRFKSILQDQAVFHNRGFCLRLLGDVLSDRMSHDALTIALLDEATKNNIQITIIFSNHDSMFFKALYKPLAQLQLPQSLRHFYMSGLKFISFMKDYRNSEHVAALRLSIINYIKLLKMFDFEETDVFDNDGAITTKDLCIFSHAAIQLYPLYVAYAQFAPLGDSKDIRYANKSTIKEFIKNINHAFMTSAYASIVPGDTTDIARFDRIIAKPDSYIYRFIWDRLASTIQAHDYLPLLRDQTRIINIHGHDRIQRVGDLTLDNDVGKSIEAIEAGIIQTLRFCVTGYFQ